VSGIKGATLYGRSQGVSKLPPINARNCSSVIPVAVWVGAVVHLNDEAACRLDWGLVDSIRESASDYTLQKPISSAYD
jgi:hypothetical protein